ncbi:MAG: hypothetical protein RL535_503, partial [Pseudomonadota bacterium]
MSGWPAGLVPDLATPYSYAGDGMAYLWNIQRVIEGAWFFVNERAGFPFGSNHLDFPTSDTGSYLILKLLSLLIQTSSSLHNLYFLIGFSLNAAAAFLVARTLGVSRPFSVVAGLLYTFVFFHFGRIGHLFFTWYFVAPLFFYIGFRLVSKQFVFTNSQFKLSSKLVHVFALFFLASFGIYYSLFGCLVIAVCIVLTTLLYRSWQIFREGAITLGLVILGVLLNVSPSLIYLQTQGENREGVHRLASEAELYSLKIIQLLLPRADHRLESFFKLADSYNSTFPSVNENVSASLGMVGSLGFLFLLAFIVLSPFLKTLHNNTHRASESEGYFSMPFKFQILATLCLCLLLFGTVGGFSSIFSLLVSSAIRSWNRISIFIAFISILAFLMVIDALLTKLVHQRYWRFVSICVAAFIFFLGMFDQTTKPSHMYEIENKDLVDNDREFIQALEANLPEKSAIYQLPYMAYPESGAVNALGSYDQARGHLHSKQLRWSFGGIRGREHDWFYRKLSVLPIQQQVTVVSAMGFAGIYIDRRGYLNEPPQAAQACAAFLADEVSQLKHHCLTFSELTQKINNTVQASNTVQKPMLSKDANLVFIALRSKNTSEEHESQTALANTYLQPIGYQLIDRVPVQTEGGFEEAIDFRKDDLDLPTYAAKISGTADVAIDKGERLGRWSDALTEKHVTVWLAKPLPKKFTLQLRAQAAGMNIFKPMQIKVGKQIQSLQFGKAFETKSATFETSSPIYKIEFIPADPFSPARRWGSGDTDLIAIMFQQLQIVPQ